MKKINLTNKKIGIWGLGIVGKSVLEYAQRYTKDIQIMDKIQHPSYDVIAQTEHNIAQFLEHNDIIIASPGIMLHDYENYRHKFINELDIFAQEFDGTTIAITGTVGKTTVTSLLQQCIPGSIAAGNIGYGMLNLLNLQPMPKQVVLELSSYQLQKAQYFAPEIAVWTNFYPNHLDHHKDEQEYFDAKCNMLSHQNADQQALLPYEIIDKILQSVTPKAQVFLLSETKSNAVRPECFAQQNVSKDTCDKSLRYPIFFINNNNVVLEHHDQQTIIFDQFDQLPDITFAQNWLIIVATLYLQKISLSNLITLTKTLKPEPHRVEFVRNFNGVSIYNDSKSTVWQATKQAVERFNHKKIALFLGGISKGTDRTPLIQHLANKSVIVFAFGKEAEQLALLCEQFNIVHFKSATLQDALQQYIQHQAKFDILLFSPAGASFDLFKNFEDRGDQFKTLINLLA